MSSYVRLTELLKKAKGSRSLNQFAADSGVDAGHMSRIMRGIMVNPPVPDTLRRIAEKAQNHVTFHELMVAAGHLQADMDEEGAFPVLSVRNSPSMPDRLSFMDAEIEKWVTDPEHYSYIKLAFEAYSSGLLRNCHKKSR